MPFQRRLLALGLFLTPLACGLASTRPDDEPGPDPAATTRILFVGNSLTYVNDLPGMVKALADSRGISGVQAATVAFPDYSLEDHWNNGQAGRVISKGGWHYVVMQQGPSAVLANAPDGLHASVSGTYLAALTVFGGRFHRSVMGVPRGLSVTGGSFQIPAAQALLLQQAADQVNGPLIHP
jgi:hypothetical protein